MIRHSLVVGTDDLARFDGSVVCRDLRIDLANGQRTIRRGTLVDLALRQVLAGQSGATIDVLSPEPGEIEQPEASRRLAAALAGEGVSADNPHQGQVILHAYHGGIARVSGETVRLINSQRAFLVATALDGRVVETGDTLAVVKGARLWISEGEVNLALGWVDRTARLRVAPFRARRAAFVAGPRTRVGSMETAAENLRRALNRYGTDLVETRQINDDAAVISALFREQVDAGIEIILIAGSIVLDPGDPFLVAIETAGGKVACLGAPIDPGTMFWVGYVEHTAIMGLASCEMYGRVSVLDLLLPYAVAGEPITADLLAELGYGGLLNQTFSSRQTVFVAEPDQP